jgi:hypothetical protein
VKNSNPFASASAAAASISGDSPSPGATVVDAPGAAVVEAPDSAVVDEPDDPPHAAINRIALSEKAISGLFDFDFIPVPF